MIGGTANGDELQSRQQELNENFSADAIIDDITSSDGLMSDIHASADCQPHLTGEMTNNACASFLRVLYDALRFCKTTISANWFLRASTSPGGTGGVVGCETLERHENRR